MTGNIKPLDKRAVLSFFHFSLAKVLPSRQRVTLSDNMTEQIVILDFGSQYTQVIARRIRECNVYSVILRHDTPAAQIAALSPKGIILSGGPSSVYAKNAPLPDRNLFALRIPVLGV